MPAPAQLRWRDADGPTDAKGGTLWREPMAHRPSQNGAASPRLTIYGPSGSTYALNQAATIEGPTTIPTTTLVAPSGTGSDPDSPLRLSSTTGIKSRMRLVLGSPSGDSPAEVVKVRRVLGTTGLLLFTPLLHTHELGALIGGCRLSATIIGTQVPDRFRRGRAVWEWGAEGSSVRDQSIQTAVDVVRYPVGMVATEDNLREHDAVFWQRIADSRDPLELLERGWDYLTQRLTVLNVWAFVASEPLRWPTVYYAVWLEMLTWGKEHAEAAEAMRKLAETMLKDAVMANPSDPDEDATLTEREQPLPRTIRWYRTT